jgi:hypothetical protein
MKEGTEMDGIIFGLFALSAVLLFGAFYNTISLKKPGFYPPKKILKKRAALLAASGFLGFLLGMFLSMIQ